MSDIVEPVAFVENLHLFSADPAEVRFSYSKPSDTFLKRLAIRSIERLTGQPKLKRLYQDWAIDPPPGENIFAAGLRLMDIKIQTNQDNWTTTPPHGPLLIIANHPFGVVDGLAIMAMALKLRPDVKIMVHSLLCQPPEAQNFLLPVDFSGTADARATSAATRRRTMAWLSAGHCVVIFPAGGVATSQNPWRGPAIDSAWHGFVARLTRVRALKILPVFFEGQNSRAFHLASHINYALRIALLFGESARRMGSSITATAGEAIDATTLPHDQGKTAVMKCLRRATYALGGQDGEAEFVWPKHVNAN